MHASIKFGFMSLILAFGAFQGLVVAALLLSSRRNRTANRILAALMIVTVLRILPYILGYAGFYDAYPQLSFAPYNLGLAFGPLVFLYVKRLTSDSLPRRSWIHLLPALVEFCYYSSIFTRSLTFKIAWDRQVHEPWVALVEQLLILLSATIYTGASVRMYRKYQQWLTNHFSFSEEFRATWLRNFLGVFAVLLFVWAAFVAMERLVHPLNYFKEFPLYILFTLFTYYLGLEGWRHSGASYPSRSAVESAAALQESPADSPSQILITERDWTAQASLWLQEIERRELWRNPDLSLASLAQALGTNTTYVSKAFNDGLGQSFSEGINRLRIKEVQKRLQSQSLETDLLTIALDAGFRSKASFNRAFKQYVGQTPSEYRVSLPNIASQIVKVAET